MAFSSSNSDTIASTLQPSFLLSLQTTEHASRAMSLKRPFATSFGTADVSTRHGSFQCTLYEADSPAECRTIIAAFESTFATASLSSFYAAVQSPFLVSVHAAIFLPSLHAD